VDGLPPCRPKIPSAEVLPCSPSIATDLKEADAPPCVFLRVAVYNPPPSGGISAEFEIPNYGGIRLAVNDLVYDPGTGMAYASGGSAGDRAR
jgi:hypothetical protein